MGRLEYVGPFSGRKAEIPAGPRVMRRVRKKDAGRVTGSYVTYEDEDDEEPFEERAPTRVAAAARRSRRSEGSEEKSEKSKKKSDESDSKDDDDSEEGKRSKLLTGVIGTGLAAAAGIAGAKLLGKKSDSGSDDSDDSDKKKKRGWGRGRGKDKDRDASDGEYEEGDSLVYSRRGRRGGGGGLFSAFRREPPELPSYGVTNAGEEDPDMLDLRNDNMVLRQARVRGVRNVLYVPQTHNFVCERYGLFSRVLYPGKNILHRGEEVTHVHSMMIRSCRIDEGFETEDGMEVGVQARLMMRVMDARLASYSVEDPMKALIYIALDALRSNISRLPVDVCFAETDLLSLRAREAINYQARTWGWRCIRVILDVAPSNEIREQMLMRAMKEREGLSMLSDRKRAANLNAIDLDHRLHVRERMMYTDELEFIHRCQAQAEARVAESSAELRKMRDLAEFIASEPHAEAAIHLYQQQKETEFMRDRAAFDDRVRAHSGEVLRDEAAAGVHAAHAAAAAAETEAAMSMAGSGLGRMPPPGYGHPHAAGRMFPGNPVAEAMSMRSGIPPQHGLGMGYGAANHPMGMGMQAPHGVGPAGMYDPMDERAASMHHSMHSGAFQSRRFGPQGGQMPPGY